MGDVKQMINAQMFYVYEWYIVETGEIFYVGKGSGNRVTSMKDRNEYFKNIRKKTLAIIGLFGTLRMKNPHTILNSNTVSSSRVSDRLEPVMF